MVKMLASARANLIYHPLGRALETTVKASEYSNTISCENQGTRYEFRVALSKTVEPKKADSLNKRIREILHKYPIKL